MALGARIRERREELGLSQAELAKRVGSNLTQGAVSNLENRDSPSSRKASRFAEVLDVNLRWLETGRGPKATDPIIKEILANQFKLSKNENSLYNVVTGPSVRGAVPLISWVKAGGWSSVADAFSPGDAEAWMPCPTNYGPNTFALRVRGVSMEPKFQDGDIIFVDPDASADHGKNVVVRMQDEDEATFKQLVVEGSKMFLKPLNPDWPGQKLIAINGNATICGVVIGKWVAA